MRGKDPAGPRRDHRGGIIPAGTGKRSAPPASATTSRDHPRGCGEKTRAARSAHATWGSSPRVRGKAWAPVQREISRRIIPAGAGKSLPDFLRPQAVGDHPRGCGEKHRRARRPRPHRGSSPRVRGKGCGPPRRRRRAGIIPAGAGKRSHRWLHTSRPWDHPRGCGEKSLLMTSFLSVGGSSPRVRGKGAQVLNFSLMSGIIPAGAGKRRYNSRTFRGGGDYPRGCGEKWKMLPWIVLWPGSSPRVRGKAPTHHRRHLPLCIIPAGAGKSSGYRAVWRLAWDHPRGCGEKSISLAMAFLRSGSSPRVRGKVRPRPRL